MVPSYIFEYLKSIFLQFCGIFYKYMYAPFDFFRYEQMKYPGAPEHPHGQTLSPQWATVV